jgi:excinuclease ABC subunit B
MGITPQTISKSVEDILILTDVASNMVIEEEIETKTESMSNIERMELLDHLTKKMHELSAELEFEKAAEVRDMIRKVRKDIKDN